VNGRKPLGCFDGCGSSILLVATFIILVTTRRHLHNLSNLWYPQPLSTALLELLMWKRGSSTDVELYDALRDEYPDLSFLAMNKMLMSLELDGFIHVYSMTKNQRGVELTC
jgi:hypothetical protein